MIQWENENSLDHATEETSPFTSPLTNENGYNPVTEPFLTHLRLKPAFEELPEEDILRTQDIEDGLEGIKRDFLVPGDLVDLKFGGNNNELAIFMQRLDSQSQYYTMSGRWLHQRGTNVNIYFPHFVTPEELHDLRQHLPKGDISVDQIDSLHSFERALSRSIGGPLLRKMKDFWTQANAVFEATASKLDKSYMIVAHPTEFRYATISELADRILSGIIPKNKAGKFPDPALYALHRRIFCENAGFIPANLRKARGEAQYEILPISITEEMSRVLGYVRKFNIFRLTHGKTEHPTEVLTFAKKAYEIIRKSRKTRDFTVYGNIGPYRGWPEQELKSARRENFDGTNLEFVRFLEIWAGLNSLGTMLGCTYDSAGSTILRAIGQYSGEEILLNKQIAWTCLKELGAIPPWQIVSEYGIRAPNASCRLSLSPELIPSHTNYSIDGMKDFRTRIKNTTYCIDDTDALELDDGLSLEATDSPEEYWVHIHVADPTSILDPHGPESKYAQARGNTVFLPGCKIPMLDHDNVMKHMSLAEGRPCLTISAKLNFKGELLDSKIHSGTLGNVVCLTPNTFSEVVNASAISNAPLIYTTGPNQGSDSHRKLANKDQLTSREYNEIKILGRLGEARTALLQRTGAAFTPSDYESIKIHFKHTVHPSLSRDKFLPNIDPIIDIRISRSYQDYIVGHVSRKQSHGTALPAFMQLAGQISARWCNQRGITIPYRVALPQVSSQDLEAYHRCNILPLVEKGEQLPAEILSKYLASIGPAHLSVEPASHPALGMDMYTKATSPLRRYLDMVVHWQINAALREEALSNKTLVGNNKEKLLPFSKSWLKSILPHMTRLERWAKFYEMSAVQEWKCQFLLRAWKYSHAKIPHPLVFVAKQIVLGSRNCVFGELTYLAMKTLMEVPEFINFKEIKEGDMFDVEISDINVHSQKVMLKALRKLKLEDIPKLDQTPGC